MSLTMLRDLAVFSSLFLRIIVLPFQKVNKVVCVIIYLFFFYTVHKITLYTTTRVPNVNVLCHYAPAAGVMFSSCPSRYMSRANVGSRVQASPFLSKCKGESIPVQKWNSPQDGQVHYTDAASGSSSERGRSSAVKCCSSVIS